jgi:hypothetical protein
MKRTTTIIAIAALICCLMTGCKLKTYYQVYQATPVNEEEMPIQNGKLINENNDCIVSYNFFEEYGHGGFWFTNNTDSVIYIYCDETFFIINGEAKDYYQARRWTTTTSQTQQSSTESGTRKKHNKRSTATTLGTSQTSTSAVANEELRYVIIPPHSTKHLNQFPIQVNRILACNLKEKPGRTPSPKGFSIDDSPVVFGNYITYSVGKGKNSVKKHIDNRFYVSEISNHSSKSIILNVPIKNECQKNTGEKETKLKGAGPNRFYVTYKK